MMAHQSNGHHHAHTEQQEVAVVDIGSFLHDPHSPEARAACKAVAESLQKFSCLVIKDPRVNEQHNSNFVDQMEKYFSQNEAALNPDIHPEYSYQVGATPSFVEVPRDHSAVIETLKGKDAANRPKGADPKWRFFWRIGERPAETNFPELNMPQVLPKAFPQWAQTMDQWGALMLSAIQTVARMSALGLDLPENTFVEMLHHGPHLLAPTGSDYTKHHAVNTVLAGFHYDLNFLTIHGKSRFPGLYIWTREMKKMPVKVPDGCLLLQAGKQLEWVTGGAITAGFHEVIISDATLQAIEKAKAENRPLWRISSTLFSHVASDLTLKPLGKFAEAPSASKYPPITAGDQVNEELALIKLSPRPSPRPGS